MRARITSDARPNEITAAPQLLKMLRLEGAIVTSGAVNRQRPIAGRIVEQKGDSVLALKPNPGTLHDDVALLLDDAELQANRTGPLVEADHGGSKRAQRQLPPRSAGSRSSTNGQV